MNSKKQYLYLIAKSKWEADLINAECQALIGKPPDENGIIISERKVDVSRGAYIKNCVELIFQTASLEQLHRYLEAAKLYADDFRVSVTKIPRGLKMNSMELASEIGARIEGSPDLDNPKVIFYLVATDEQLWFGKITSESDRAWIKHTAKPHTTSSSLPARLCRAVVNIIADIGDSLVDPCCGAGTLLLEAAHIGINVVGYDINKKMVGASRKNLEYFGLEGAIHLADAREITGRFDALTTDLPYGIYTQASDKLYREILQNIKSLAPKAALITAKDITDMLCDLGYEAKRVIPVPKSRVTRYIHIVDILECND
ncbi:TPA: methyltransferase domain-containing protein [Candidatus Poribacteria bacterium]|nr:methyltransferase domain-containing protein [Candidatus Poribacteria bacterium]